MKLFFKLIAIPSQLVDRLICALFGHYWVDDEPTCFDCGKKRHELDRKN